MCAVIGLKDRRNTSPSTPILPQLAFSQRFSIAIGTLTGILLGAGIAIQVIHSLLASQQTAFNAGIAPLWTPADGLLAAGVLFLAGLTLRRATNAIQITPLLFLTAVLGAGYVGLLIPPHTSNHESPATAQDQPQILILTWLFSLILIIYVWGRRRSVQKKRMKLMRQNPDQLTIPIASSVGMSTACGALGIVIVLLSCFSLAAPISFPTGGFTAPALLQALATTLAAIALFFLIYESWNIFLADIALGLMSLTICLFIVAFLPGHDHTLAERFPMIFNAVLIGLAIMAWIWNWLASVWEQQLENGNPWTSSGHLHFAIGDFTFRLTSFALLIAILMAAWPIMRGVAASDNSPNRFAYGIAGYLVLLIALISCGKRTRRSRYKRLSVITTLCMFMFIWFRVS